MRLWNALTGEHLATLDHKSPVLSVAFGPGDSLFASGSEDGNARLWDPAGELLATLGHESPVRSVAFSPDGSLLVSGAEDGKVRQWQVRSVASCCPRNPANDFDTMKAAGNESPRGIWSDGTTMWVVDDWDDKLYAYDMAFRDRDPARDFTTLDAAGNNKPSGIWSDGTTMWVADYFDRKLYAYDMASRARDSSKGFQYPGCSREHEATGHLVRRNHHVGGRRLGRETVRLRQDIKSPGTAKDFDTAGNHYPTGLWSDGASLWVANYAGSKLHAYDLTTKASEPDKDFLTLRSAGNNLPVGIWSDGTTMWVTDDSDRKLYAYDMPTDGERPVVDAPQTPGTGTTTPPAQTSAATDFNGDGKTDFVDFFEFIDAFGSTDSRFDLDGNGTVDFVDFFEFVDAFGQEERAKMVAIAQEMIALPTETRLHQNAPNPFNSETVISWFLLEPMPAQLEVFSLTGQRVAVLHQGPRQAGRHRIHWDGRDIGGRPLASGVYLYRLVTDESVLTRKLTLLR